MDRLFVILLTLISIMGCTNMKKDCDSPKYYFPLKRNLPNIGLDTSINVWYSENLSSLHEPNFRCDQPCEQIRITYLFSYRPPEIYRLEKCKDRIHGIYKRANNSGEIVVESSFHHEEIILDLADWNTFNERYTSLKKTRQSNLISAGSDGSIWLIERIHQGKHEYMERWTLELKGRDDELFNYCQQIQKKVRSF